MFFGGKGGVGKTTCAAACAVASAHAGRRVLVVSTDPAHSLGDVLGVRLSSRATRIHLATGSSTGGLEAVELNARRIYARWLSEHRRPVGDIIEHGTWLERDDVEALLDLALPGVDELVAMMEIMHLVDRRRGRCDLVVVDTAPTGHALRLFGAARTVGGVAALLDDLEEEHRTIRRQFARVVRPEAADLLIESLESHAGRTADLLRDTRQTTIRWVTLPEELAHRESLRAIQNLKRLDLSIADVIVNRLTPPGPSCPVCDARRVEEGRWLLEIQRSINRQVRLVAALNSEPRGVKALLAVGGSLERAEAGALKVPARRHRISGREDGVASAAPDPAAQAAAQALLDGFATARFVFVAGKGGVGKTTVAAALALRLSRRAAVPVLLLSTDPAHSIGDVLGLRVGDRSTVVPGTRAKLYAREIDAPTVLARHRADLEGALEEMAATAGGAAPGVVGGRAVGELFDLAPPGIDELLGLLSLLDVREPSAPDAGGTNLPAFGLVVVDMAPTGHALRLLAMPDAVREWAHVLLRLMLKYREVVRPGRLAEALMNMSKKIRALEQVLHDPAQARFVTVTRAAEVPIAETARLLGELRRLGLHVPVVIANAMTLAPGACPRCRANTRREQGTMERFGRVCGSRRRRCAIIQSALTVPGPRGAAALEAWADTWINQDDARD